VKFFRIKTCHTNFQIVSWHYKWSKNSHTNYIAKLNFINNYRKYHQMSTEFLKDHMSFFFVNKCLETKLTNLYIVK
jgi:hypothetical protein